MADQKITQLDAVVTPDNADLVAQVQDVATTPVTKKITWTVIKAFLKTYFDTLYPSGSGTSSGTNTGDQTLPVKATGAEIDTGTDNAKMVTPKAIADSKLISEDTTDTLTNKRITPRVTTEASSATPTINTDNSDMHSITALAVAITSMTTNLSGTPTNGQKLIIRFLDNATGRSITWGASFEDNGQALPTTTVASKLLTVGFIYDTVSSKWGCVAVANET